MVNLGINDNMKNFNTKIVIFNKTKNRVEATYHNVITIDGKALYADRLINNNVNPIDYFAVGDGVVTHDETSTSLLNEVFRKQLENKSSPGNKALFEVTILGYEAIGNWTEIGLFNESILGVLTNVADVSYNHVIGDEVAISWSVTLA